MLLGTTYLLKDEKCFGVLELNFKTPDHRERHRYQITQVVRDDKVAEHRRDLGNIKKHKGVDQFRIPGGVWQENGKFAFCHTVGELQNIAKELRHGKTLFDKLDLLQVNAYKE